MLRRLIGFSATSGLLLGLLGVGAVSPAAADVKRLPAADFRPCISETQQFCIESVTFTVDGFEEVQGIWVPSGQSVPNADLVQPEPGSNELDNAADTEAISGANVSISPTGSYPGRWSFPDFPKDFVGYDGVYVQVGPASRGSDFAWVRLNPAAMRSDGSVGRAVAAEGSTSPRDLDDAMQTTVVMRFGQLEPTANIQVADGRIANSTINGNNIVTFTGYPIVVPRARASADCLGTRGSALDLVRQQYAFIVFGNTRQSFGYDGMSGGLSIATNGACRITAPTYDSRTGDFSFTASAPRFAPDGIQVNRGFYIATIPMQDATLLFGVTNAQQVRAALELSVENEEGIDVPVQYSVAVRRGVITVAALNFQYSQPTFTLRVKNRLWDRRYKKQARQAQREAANRGSSGNQEIRIRCVKSNKNVQGPKRVVVTGSESRPPRCPRGYRPQ